MSAEVAQVIAALLWLTAMAPNRTPLHKDPTARLEMARAFVEQGKAHDLDPLLLVALAFRESSLRTNAIGKLGELGVMQVIPDRVARRHCDMSTVRGQIACGAAELAEAIGLCNGSIEGGIARYTSGRTCRWGEEAEPGLHRVVAGRIRIWEGLKTRFAKENDDENDHDAGVDGGPADRL